MDSWQRRVRSSILPADQRPGKNQKQRYGKQNGYSTALASETCECGRTLRRIKRIGRRADDMFIVRGINVFPSQIETALLKVEGTLPHYQIVLTRERDLDVMEVQVEVTPEVFTDTVGALEQLQNKLSKSIETTVGVRANVRLVQPRTIQRSEGKAKRVIDQRKM